MMIWLDMDGTIADFYKGEWLNAILEGSTKPYEVAGRLVEEEVLQALVNNGYSLGIISWCAKGNNKKYDKQVRLAKRNWLKVNYPNIRFKHIHIVKYGTPKEKFYSFGDILVDDEEPNRKNWKGVALEPKEIMKW